MTAAIVEFDPLTDAIWPTPQDHHFFLVRGPCFAFYIAKSRRLIGRIHIRGLRFKFSRTGVNPLEHGLHTHAVARFAHIGFAKPGQSRQSSVGKAHHFQCAQTVCVLRQTTVAHVSFRLNDLADAGQKPRVKHRNTMDVFVAQPVPHGLRNRAHPVRRLETDCTNNRRSVRGAFNLDLIKSRQPCLQRSQRFLQRFMDRAPNAHHLANRFHRSG